ncbi:MAG TPA: acetyl-CoA C-acetyltransferase, partial [Herminiimonas sp.]|nr:acetyl-CoA C-acetyltransferase [Herminiimonas sp.]
MDSVVIGAAGRTGVGKFGGALSGTPASDLGAHIVRKLLERTGIPTDQISEVILGQVLTAGCGQNPARQASIRGGLPDMVPAFTINKVCGSGLKAVHLATQAIKCGDAQIIIAGGQENMSAAPHVLNHSREGFRMGDAKLIDSMINDGLWDVYNQYHMGTTAENIAKQYGISRQEQDEFALQSQNKAEAAQKAGRFAEEIIPFDIVQKKSSTVFDTDEYVKHGATMALLAALRPAFSKDGTVTAGNASGINDGAAAVILMTATKANELGLKPLARIKAYSSAGVDPSVMGMGPVPAAKLCLQKAGWKHQDVDLMEINEAFAAQAIAV